jgi:RHS repeat-associated protein
VLTDANGNVTQDETGAGYSWDVRGRLYNVNRNGVNSYFSYTAEGERIYQSANTPITTYLLDGDNVVQENTSGTTTNLLQGPGTDNLLERGSNWIVPASLGSTSTVVDGSGAVQQRYYYQPFGQLSMAGGGTPQPYQFTGREADATGLMYYRARYYNPSWGRFISEDPAGFAGSTNPYVYADNNPLRNSDPTGRIPNGLLPHRSSTDPHDPDFIDDGLPGGFPITPKGWGKVIVGDAQFLGQVGAYAAHQAGSFLNTVGDWFFAPDEPPSGGGSPPDSTPPGGQGKGQPGNPLPDLPNGWTNAQFGE